MVNLQIVSKTAGAGSLFWKTEAIPSGAMPAFPEPLGADSPPAAVLLPNSPLLIHASSSSMSAVSSRMPVLAVTSGKGRKSPEGHCQLSRAHSVPTPPASCAAPKLTLVDPGQELFDVLRDVLRGVRARCHCWQSKTIPSGATPALPQPAGADSLPPALQPLNSPPDSSVAALQVSGAVAGWGHTSVGAGCPWSSESSTASGKGSVGGSRVAGRVRGTGSGRSCREGTCKRTGGGPGRPGARGRQVPGGCGGSAWRSTAPGRGPIGCPAGRGCPERGAGAVGGAVPGCGPPGRSSSTGKCGPAAGVRPPGGS